MRKEKALLNFAKDAYENYLFDQEEYALGQFDGDEMVFSQGFVRGVLETVAYMFGKETWKDALALLDDANITNSNEQ